MEYQHLMCRPSSESARQAVVSMLVDRVTAEVVVALGHLEVDCILVKGPVIAAWLYPNEVRPYGDSDLLVSDDTWSHAISVLTGLGFTMANEGVTHPRFESHASLAMVRATEHVDLHRSLDGLAASPKEVWNALRGDAEVMGVGGVEVAVPSRAAVLMHLALHAAHHHANEKPLEDLRRGLAAADLPGWIEARDLATRLDGREAFAAGLSRLPEGAETARELGVAGVGSIQTDLRLSGVPMAEGLNDLLAADMSARERIAVVVGEVLPSPSFMRKWSPLARRGRLGLVAAYPLRWVWLMIHAPRGVATLVRARRRRAYQDS